jgi:hypothetical protein
VPTVSAAGREPDALASTGGIAEQRRERRNRDEVPVQTISS